MSLRDDILIVTNGLGGAGGAGRAFRAGERGSGAPRHWGLRHRDMCLPDMIISVGTSLIVLIGVRAFESTKSVIVVPTSIPTQVNYKGILI